MIKKLLYFGIGLASLLYENFDELVRTGEERYNEMLGADLPEEETFEIETVVSEEAEVKTEDNAQDLPADDLTKITGIGPTFAMRLKDAGITTYQALAELDEDQVREITSAADWQADPGVWIAEAKALA